MVHASKRLQPPVLIPAVYVWIDLRPVEVALAHLLVMVNAPVGAHDPQT